MAKIILLLLLLLPACIIRSQDLLGVALSDKTRIISKTPLKINIYVEGIQMELAVNKNYFDAWKTKGVDSTLISELITESNFQNPSLWENQELKNAIIVQKGEKINLKEALKFTSKNSKEEIKALKYDIRTYNSHTPNWRKIPVGLSRPVYSKNQQFAMIAFRFGNEEGFISLYKKEKSNWVFIGNLGRWVY